VLEFVTILHISDVAEKHFHGSKYGPRKWIHHKEYAVDVEGLKNGVGYSLLSSMAWGLESH